MKLGGLLMAPSLLTWDTVLPIRTTPADAYCLGNWHVKGLYELGFGIKELSDTRVHVFPLVFVTDLKKIAH